MVLIAMPFSGLGILLIGMMLTVCFGGCQIKISGEQGIISTGAGPIRWRKKFNAMTVQSLRIEENKEGRRKGEAPCLVINDGKEHRLGTLLPDHRKRWLLDTLSTLLMPDSKTQHTRTPPQTHSPKPTEN